MSILRWRSKTNYCCGCKHCEVETPWYDIEEKAIEVWNTRADAEIRAKTIDEFVDKAYEMLGVEDEDIYCKETIDEIAEQLRKGGVSE